MKLFFLVSKAKMTKTCWTQPFLRFLQVSGGMYQKSNEQNNLQHIKLLKQIPLKRYIFKFPLLVPTASSCK